MAEDKLHPVLGVPISEVKPTSPWGAHYEGVVWVGGFPLYEATGETFWGEHQPNGSLAGAN